MSNNLNGYSVTVVTDLGKEREINVLPVEESKDINWRIPHKGGYLNFKTKESVKTYLKRKFAEVKG